jgi:hypothetical protein
VNRHIETNILLVNAPNTFDFCKVKAFNRKLDKHMKSFHNASTSDRDHFIHYGLHLDREGKNRLQKQTANSIQEILKLQQKDPIKIGWKEEQKANAISNNVDKDGGQVIHEEQAIRNQG